MDVVPFIVGPTGIGKTAISVIIADKMPIEIVSADSRQIYKYMDIGTATPSRDILRMIPHHFINYLTPDKYFSAGMYGREARVVIKQIIEKGKVPLVVGGSGFYIKALVDGLSEIMADDEEVRARFNEKLRNEGVEKLHKELAKVDPDLAARIKKRDKQRILRGLEVYYATDNRLSDLQMLQAEPADFQPLLIGLTAEREFLYQNINRRVDEMISNGLVQEVEMLMKKGYTVDMNALNTVGYKEVFEYIAGNITENEMIEEIKKNSRRYAKRQLTWFRKDTRIQWLDINKKSQPEQIADKIMDRLKKFKP
jgi:tRNA dimethylallyltransferase